MKRKEYSIHTHFRDEDADRKINDLSDPGLWQATESKYEGKLSDNYRPFEKLKGTPNLKSIFSDRLDPSVHGHRIKRDFITDENIEKFYAKKNRRQLKVTNEVKMTMLRRKEVALEARDLQNICREVSDKIIKTMIGILDNPDSSDNSKIAASNLLLDRGYGKAAATNVNINANADAKPSELDGRDLDKRVADTIRQLEKLTDGTPEEGESEKRPSSLREYN
jgi:hypothetical protein